MRNPRPFLLGARMTLVALLAAMLAAGAAGTAAKPAVAGTFPALLDRNAGSVMNPLVIHNLYWDTSWDADNPGMPMARIDDATRAMISSGYLGKLAQYGVTSITFSGSNQADPSCGGAAPSVDYFSISGFVLCEKHFFNLAPLGSQGVVYMVYTPVSSMFSMLGFTSCPPGGSGMSGFHYQTLPSIIPLDVPQVFGVVFAQCAGSLDETTAAGAHELVEAATDPFPPFDWIDNSVVTPTSIGSVLLLFTAAEASDLCEGGVGSPAPVTLPPTSAHPRVTGSLQSYAVDYYWSNADGACVPLPHTISLAQSGLPFAGTAHFDSSNVALPFTTVVADGTSHSFSFPSVVPDPANPAGTRFVTTAAAFSGTVSSSISETATYTKQFLLTVVTAPAAAAAGNVTLTPSGWHDAGSVVNLAADALVSITATDRYRFSSWSGATPGGGTAATVAMTAPATVTANYVLQHLVTFAENGIPAGVTWSVTVNGTTMSGPTSVWFDHGARVSFSYQTPVQDPNPGTRYVLALTLQPSPVIVTGAVTVVGQYITQELLTVSTAGLGTAVTTIANGGVVLGTATDAAPLEAWLVKGTALSLSADAVVTGSGGTQLFFQGFAPAPPTTLASPFATTAAYNSVAGLIASGLASGQIDNRGIAHSLLTQFGHAQADIAAGRPAKALSDLRAFIQHVAAQSGHHVDPALARTLELDALLSYHEELCAAVDAGLLSPHVAANDYSWYAARVRALGGIPLPPC